MNTRTRIAAAITGGAAVVALLAANPSIAATGPTGATQPTPATSANQQNAQQMGDCDGTGAGPGYGRGNGQGRNGQGRNGQGAGMQGRGAGMGADLTNVPSGTLTATQKTKLAAMAEEEKLAQDLYVAFGEKYGTPFNRITNAETRHLAEVRIVLKRYAITDPTAGKAAGIFTTASTQQLYNKLLAQGTASVDGANTSARTVEATDITDLKAAATGVTAPDVTQVYKNLLAASERHLVAFGG
jgi:hypothetical protein